MKKNRILLYIISTLLWFSLYCYVSEFSLYALNIGATMSQLGLISSCYGLTQVLLRIPLGILSDTVGKRKCFITLGTLLSSLASLLLIIKPQIITLFVFKIICGGAASCWVLYTITYASYYSGDQTQQAIGKVNSANSLGQITGMILGGILVMVTKDQSNVFILSFIAAFIATVLTLLLNEIKFIKKKINIKSFIIVLSNKTLIINSILAIFVQIVMYAATFTYGPVLAQSYGMNGLYRSLYIGVGILPTALFAPIICSSLVKKLGYIKTLYFGFTIIIVISYILSLIDHVLLLYVSHFIIGFGYAMTFPLVMSLSVSKIDPSNRASAMGIFQAIYGLGIIIGPSLLGTIIDKFSMEFGFQILSLCTIGALIIIKIFKKNIY